MVLLHVDQQTLLCGFFCIVGKITTGVRTEERENEQLRYAHEDIDLLYNYRTCRCKERAHAQ